MLDGKAYKARLSDDPDPDLIPRLCDPAFCKPSPRWQAI
jgi:hypothetical protein